jgi:hypothetical protein
VLSLYDRVLSQGEAAIGGRHQDARRARRGAAPGLSRQLPSCAGRLGRGDRAQHRHHRRDRSARGREAARRERGEAPGGLRGRAHRDRHGGPAIGAPDRWECRGRADHGSSHPPLGQRGVLRRVGELSSRRPSRDVRRVPCRPHGVRRRGGARDRSPLRQGRRAALDAHQRPSHPGRGWCGHRRGRGPRRHRRPEACGGAPRA